MTEIDDRTAIRAAVWICAPVAAFLFVPDPTGLGPIVVAAGLVAVAELILSALPGATP